MNEFIPVRIFRMPFSFSDNGSKEVVDIRINEALSDRCYIISKHITLKWQQKNPNKKQEIRTN